MNFIIGDQEVYKQKISLNNKTFEQVVKNKKTIVNIF